MYLESVTVCLCGRCHGGAYRTVGVGRWATCSYDGDGQPKQAAQQKPQSSRAAQDEFDGGDHAGAGEAAMAGEGGAERLPPGNRPFARWHA